LAGGDLHSAIGGERPARRDWRGETCAVQLTGRDLRGAIGGERTSLRARDLMGGEPRATCAERWAARDLMVGESTWKQVLFEVEVHALVDVCSCRFTFSSTCS